MLTINNLKTEERKPIIKNLETNKIVYEYQYVDPNSKRDYIFTNDCWKIPLDKNGKQKKEEAIDISNNEQLINELRQEYLDRPKRMKRLEKEMEMINQSWLSGELID